MLQIQTPPTIEQIKQLAFQLSPQDLVTLVAEIQTQLAQAPSHPVISDDILHEMANDPEIQSELSTIQQEFAVTEIDGLAAS